MIDSYDFVEDTRIDFYDFVEDIREELLGSDNPYTIGGRCSDVAQIGYSLRKHVEGAFPDGAPERLQTRLDELIRRLEQAEHMIFEFLTLYILESSADVYLSK